MLILKRVEIQGFKSFCDRTEMRFPGRGIAAVVGPNGCGKSNLSDAITWVLGEQSAKSLRGTRMEDVIFAGTRERKPLGMAQVSMTLVDPGGETVHTDGSEGPTNGHAKSEREITITRRLFRSGESEYLIDGRHSRLRDIQDLFMGTGLGPESYAIIEQGRIGQVLSAKPLDRRAVIEEAAGISRFKTKRRLAEAKLEGAKANLTRVFDILEEVTRQVNSLRRQAGKARRFEELKTELTEQLGVALVGRHILLGKEAARVAQELAEATAAWQSLQQQIDADDKALGEARETFYRTEAELTEARRRLAEVRIELERTRGQVESQVKQITAIEQRLEEGETETASLTGRQEALGQEQHALAEQHEELTKQATAARERLSAKNAERESLQGELRQKETALEQLRQEVVRLLGEASVLRNQVGQIETYLEGTERDMQRVRREEETAQADLSRLDAAKKEFSEKLSQRQLELESIQERQLRVESELAERRSASVETRRSADELRNEISHVRARRDSLNEILSHRAYTTESVKKLFGAVEQGQAQDLKPAGVLADFIELTDARFEKATEEFLHEELEYVVVKSWDEAQRGIDVLRGDLDGRATFLVEPNLDSGNAVAVSSPVPEPAIGPETGIVGRLSDGIRFTNGLTNAPAELLPRLARCFLTETRESAQRLATEYTDLFFLLPDGVCYHGQAVSGGKKASSGPLALKRELRELTTLFNDRQPMLAGLEKKLEQLEAEIQKLGEDRELLRAEAQKQEKETLVLDQEMRKIAEEMSRAAQKLSVSRLEIERLTKDLARSREEQERKRALAAEKEQARAAVERQVEEGRAAVEAARARVNQTAEEQSAARVELSTVEERRRGLEDALARLDRQLREIGGRRQFLADEMGRLAANKGRLIESNLALEQKMESLAGEEHHFDELARRLTESEAEQRAGLAEREERIKAERAAVTEAQEKRSQIELELVRRQGEIKYLDETCRRDLGVAVNEIAAVRPEGQPEPDEFAVADAEERVAEIRRRIESLGPVNPEALSEFKEAQQRYDFLNSQRQDLIDSIHDTEKAIREIDTESRKRFNEAFVAINEYFKEMFRTLFGGGTGEMRLVGEGDTLDQGIEIGAQPPGKRLQNVQLLSGGEKALTAIALLMAIFRYQPSPFCILDEVDAPLDDANVGRFTNLVRSMAAHTQFVVITHAKKTMEAAESLYGVTMQEQGVSKLVSVKLETPPPSSSTPPMQTAALA